MTAQELISDRIPCLRTSDTGDKVMDWMEEFHVSQLPIVNDRQFLGIVTETDVLEAESQDQPVGDYHLSLPNTLYVLGRQHVYDVIKMMATWRLDILPVVDDDKNYVGMVTQQDLIQGLSVIFGASEPGGIIILEVPHNSYNLSEIARIVESNDAKALSIYLTLSPDAGAYYITLKLNISELTRLVNTFERFKYKVVMSFFDKSQLDDTQDRYNLLLKYLNI
jgi:acetoin utilization protein AcuB